MLAVLLGVGAGSCGEGAPGGASARLERVYALRADEGVFAYARISPDGRTLAYASEIHPADQPGRIVQTVTVADLPSGRVLFSEPGIDAYWSVDGRRMIYQSFAGSAPAVHIRHHDTGAITRDVAPPGLGDYYSWGVRDGKDLILTILGKYYYLDGDRALPPAAVQPCAGIGVGERPLLSRDGKRISVFVRGTLVVRNLTDCEDIVQTGMPGAKADFSWDGRYVAFHTPKKEGRGYTIAVVDLEERTVRTVADLAGSSLFPSWTRDGRLCFRYDGPDYRGFMMASGVLELPPRPLAASGVQLPDRRAWSDVFPETPRPGHRLNLVMVWGTWSAHSPAALADLQRARAYFGRNAHDVGVLTATDPGSREEDVARLLRRHAIQLPRIPLAPRNLLFTEAHNQVPATLLFVDGQLVDRRLGAQTFDQLREWVAAQERRGTPVSAQASRQGERRSGA
ncbi:MAG TPA: hypothetical protein VLK84_07080 [Longimicrobium sp.]|nr:hypothetical protein [Longimicrobium sp.]